MQGVTTYAYTGNRGREQGVSKLIRRNAFLVADQGGIARSDLGKQYEWQPVYRA